MPRDVEKIMTAKKVEKNNFSTSLVKPFLKWAGGKGQLIREIECYYPFKNKNIIKYAEPFVGGGAVLFDILNKYSLKEVYISDINEELINTYNIIRNNVDELIKLLAEYQNIYVPLNENERKEYYLNKRERFNILKINNDEKTNIEKASLMIFLNKTCFNGLYRVNKKGLFNVPMGNYKNPCICDIDNLTAVSKKLKNVKIVCGDYKKSREFIDKNTFVYFDPPYRPLNDTSSFTAYTEYLFNDENQKELAEFVNEMDKRGAKIVVSNSDPQNINKEDNFFEKIYSKQNIKRIDALRMINSKASARGKIKELLISNFEIQNIYKEESTVSRDFNTWICGFRDSIASYEYYIDFNKVYKNIDSIKIELNILNSLIGSKNIKNDFKKLLKKYPEVLKAVPILLAKRENEIYCQDDKGGYLYQFDLKNISLDDNIYCKYSYFMEKTGLFNLLENHIINNLIDYVTGVETGLDSNGRKNRGGHLMENLVESYIAKAGFIKDETYFKEMYIHEIIEKWGIDLSAISNQGKMEKRFDFVVKTENMIYGIETNFYSSNGSKLNETARSYKTLALESNTINGFTFVWFTDGKGWTSAKNNLEETFDVMEHIYSIEDMENGIISKIFK